MDRRTFFKTTVAGLLSAIMPTGRQVTALPLAIPLFSCMVAGFQYHDGPKLIDRLRPGDRLTLLRETDNSYHTLLTLLSIPGEYALWRFTVMVLVPGLVWMTAGRLWHVVFIALGWWMSS